MPNMITPKGKTKKLPYTAAGMKKAAAMKKAGSKVAMNKGGLMAKKKKSGY
tara:strand:+ start:285 stop:437 length:153 start_codon:yes stop_codon:yes gene_type:complete